MKNTTMNNAAMNTAINTILENIGNNPEAMKALMAAIAETGKIANETKTEQVKKSCHYVICLERTTVKGEKVYHPFVMTPPTAKTPKMLIVDNAVKAQDVAQTYGMRIRGNVYAMPATEEQIKKLTELLKACNKRIVDAVNAAVRAVGMVSTNINTDVLCAQYMRQLMENCKGVIGASMTKDSEIIEKDIKVIHPTRTVAVNNCCDCGCCSHHPSNF